MKTNRLRARIILYAILIVAVGAAWVAYAELKASEPITLGDDAGAFDESLATEMSSILASRTDVLTELESIWGVNGPPGLDHPFTSVGSDFAILKNLAYQSLVEEIGRTAPPSIADDFPASPILDETLNAADELYSESVAERTGIAERIFSRILEMESEYYIRYLGYYALASAVNRDLIPYRTLDSLQLQEIKSTLYQTERDSMGDKLSRMRSGARARYEESSVILESRYDMLVAELVERLCESWANGDSGSVESVTSLRVLEDIRERLGGFSPVVPLMGLGLEPVEQPHNDRSSWLTGERAFAEEFEEFAMGDGND